MGARETRFSRGQQQLERRRQSFQDDALEFDSFFARREHGREKSARSSRPALPDLLAADLCFHLPARLLDRGCAGLDPGFFSDGS